MESNRAQLIEVSLLKSIFNRTRDLPESVEGLKFDIGVDYGYSESVLRCGLRVNVWQEKQSFEADLPNNQTLNAEVLMEGTFEVPSSLDQKIKEEFARITAPSIIYPFVREAIASLFTKANVPNIYLPVVNFKDLEAFSKDSGEN